MLWDVLYFVGWVGLFGSAVGLFAVHDGASGFFRAAIGALALFFGCLIFGPSAAPLAFIAVAVFAVFMSLAVSERQTKEKGNVVRHG